MTKKFKQVKFGERNVNFTCFSSRAFIQFIWCYDANCTRTVAMCPQNSCLEPTSICYCKIEKGQQEGQHMLALPPINHTMPTDFYCDQQYPPKVGDWATLHFRTGKQWNQIWRFLIHVSIFSLGVSLRGNNETRVNHNSKNVSFTCDGTSVLADLQWCHDSSCQSPVSLCSESSTNQSGVCYRKGEGDITLHFNTISENVTNKEYFCHQIRPRPKENSYQTLLVKLKKTGKPYIYVKLRHII